MDTPRCALDKKNPLSRIGEGQIVVGSSLTSGSPIQGIPPNSLLIVCMEFCTLEKQAVEVFWLSRIILVEAAFMNLIYWSFTAMFMCNFDEGMLLEILLSGRLEITQKGLYIKDLG
uniref:Uncharacterized protein n=1 Tax=Solanum lycopersicum TaxID=4081 RepID=A0A3Q7F084_SOLLC